MKPGGARIVYSSAAAAEWDIFRKGGAGWKKDGDLVVVK